MFMESKNLDTVNRTEVRIHPCFETYGRRHHKSKTRVSVAKQKGLMSSNFFFKKYFDDTKLTNILSCQHYQYCVICKNLECNNRKQRTEARDPPWL